MYAPSYSYSHSSTLEEGIQRGAGDFARGVGEFFERRSRAMVNGEIAREHYLDNYQKYVTTYFDTIQENKRQREYLRGPRPTSEELAKLARDAAPKPLTDNEYDRSTRTLYWPKVLQHWDFADERTRADLLFAKRMPYDSGLGTDNYRQIRQTKEKLDDKLKSKIDYFTPMEYMAAKNFLTGLEFEAQQPAASYGSGRVSMK
jgi:hypothetical protein